MQKWLIRLMVTRSKLVLGLTERKDVSYRMMGNFLRKTKQKNVININSFYSYCKHCGLF